MKAMLTSVQLPSARGSIGNQATPTTMASPAASAAPLLMPINPGSARGLRKMPCISVPAMPRPAPATRPSTRRGRRMFMNTRYSGELWSPGLQRLASTRSSCGVLMA